MKITDISNRPNLDNVIFNHYQNILKTPFNLSVYQSGQKFYSTPGFLSELSIYDHYIIHYITSGKGTYFIDEKALPVKQGQCFLIPPYKVVQYQADLKEPWSYYWVGFNGPRALDFIHLSDFHDSYIINVKSNEIEFLLKSIVNLSLPKHSMEFALIGYIHLIFAKLITKTDLINNEQNHYYRKAINYIQENFGNPSLSVEEIARYVGLTRSYLYKIFQKNDHNSILDTIHKLRLSKAVRLLELNEYSIKEISNYVGFNSQAYFSKIFKEQFKLSPTDYRKKLFEKTLNQ